MSEIKATRRQFVQGLSVATVGVLAGVGTQALAAEGRGAKPAAGGAPMVDAKTDPVAKSVNYVTDHKEIKDAKLKTDRQGVKFEAQFCKDCMLASAIAGKTDAVNCTLFAGKAVAATGWCTSWAKKS